MEEVLVNDFDYTLGDLEEPELKSGFLNDTMPGDMDQQQNDNAQAGGNKRVQRSVLMLHGVASGHRFSQHIDSSGVDSEHDADGSFGVASGEFPENVTYINTLPGVGGSRAHLGQDDSNGMDEMILQTTDLSNSPMLSNQPETSGEHGQNLDHLHAALGGMNQARARQSMSAANAATLSSLSWSAQERADIRSTSMSAPNSKLDAGNAVAGNAASQSTPMQAAHALFEQALASGMDNQALMQLAVSLGLLAPGEQHTPTSAPQAGTGGAASAEASSLGFASLMPYVSHVNAQGVSAASNITASSASVSEPLPKLGRNTLIGLNPFHATAAGLDVGDNSSLAAAIGLMSASRLMSSPGGSGPAKQHALYKTELCRGWLESGTCRYGSKCQFAHGPAELRAVPRHPKYKTEVCRSFTATGMCAYGQRCRFIHGSMSAPHNALFVGDGMGSGNMEGLEDVFCGFDDVGSSTSAMQQLANMRASGQPLPPSLAATAAALRFATGNTTGSGLVHGSAPVNVLNRSSLNQLSSGGLVGDLNAYASPGTGVGSGDLTAGNALQQLAMPPGLVPGVNVNSAGVAGSRSNVSAGRSSLDGFMNRASLRSALGLRGSDSSSSVLSEMLRRSSVDAARSSLETASSSRGRSSIESIASSQQQQQQQQIDLLSAQDPASVLNALAAAAAAAGATPSEFPGSVASQTLTNLYNTAGLVPPGASQQLFGNYSGLPKIPEGIPVQNPVMPTGLGNAQDLGNTADLIQKINKLSLGQLNAASAQGAHPLTAAQHTLLMALQQQQQQQMAMGGNEKGAWFAKSQWWDTNTPGIQIGSNQTN